MRRVAFLIGLRLTSQRVPRKLLYPIAGVPLVDWTLRILQETRDRAEVPVIAAVCGNEPELVERVHRSGLEWLPITPAMRDAETHVEIHGGWVPKLESRFDWVFNSNVPLHPFVRVETLVRIVRHTQTTDTPFITTERARELIWDDAGNPIVSDGLVVNSKTSPVLHRPNHLGAGYPVFYLADERLATSVRPWDVDLLPQEHIHCDTPEMFNFANIVARGMEQNHNQILFNPD